MTSESPIDLDKIEAAVLIDFENIRLSWEKLYQRTFRYTDLCWLCELVELKFKILIGRIVVFMSIPEQNKCCQHQEITEILRLLKEDEIRTNKLNPKSNNINSTTHSKIEQGLNESANSFDNSIPYTDSAKYKSVQSINTHIRLGQSACKQAEIFVRVYGYKLNKGRRIQRCCDVAIGSEVTKICFMSRFASIYLFSADSDFDETVKSCAESEHYEGVVKYAKSIKIFGFSHAFEIGTFKAVQRIYNFARISRSLNLNENKSEIQIYFLDYEFPVLKQLKSNGQTLCKCNENNISESSKQSKTILNANPEKILKKIPPWRKSFVKNTSNEFDTDYEKSFNKADISSEVKKQKKNHLHFYQNMQSSIIDISSDSGE